MRVRTTLPEDWVYVVWLTRPRTISDGIVPPPPVVLKNTDQSLGYDYITVSGRVNKQYDVKHSLLVR